MLPNRSAFALPRVNAAWDIDGEGKNVVRLTNNTMYDAEVTVSPDGQWIAYQGRSAGKSGLMIARPDADRSRNLTFTGTLVLTAAGSVIGGLAVAAGGLTNEGGLTVSGAAAMAARRWGRSCAWSHG